MAVAFEATYPALFDDFLIITVCRKTRQPEVVYRLSERLAKRKQSPVSSVVASLRNEEIKEFAFPYGVPSSVGTMQRSEEFAFTLSKAWENAGQSDMTRIFGFCRRFMSIGDPRTDGIFECICILSVKPLFSLYPIFLKCAHGLRLLAPLCALNFLACATKPRPYPLRGEQFKVMLPRCTLCASRTDASDRSMNYDSSESVSTLPQISSNLYNEGSFSTAGELASPDEAVFADELQFQMPASVDSPAFADVGTAMLLHALGPHNYMLTLLALLAERRVILVAQNLRKLTGCMHGCVAALQPFTWQHIFVPLLPSKMLSYVSAPFPFLIGMHSLLLPEILTEDSKYPMNEVLVVHLDHGTVAAAGAENDQAAKIFLPKLSSSPAIGIQSNLSSKSSMRSMTFEEQLPWKGLLGHPRVVRRGAEKMDQMRVNFTRSFASRLEKFTPLDVASNIETFAEKNLDPIEWLAEKLESIAASNSGKSAAWRVAKSDNDKFDYGCESLASPLCSQSTSTSFLCDAKVDDMSLGSDDLQLKEALLIFYLQLFGDPTPFMESYPNKDIAEERGVLRQKCVLERSGNSASISSIDAIRTGYRRSRSCKGKTDRPALRAFLDEVLQTQMFECFSELRLRHIEASMSKSTSQKTVPNEVLFVTIATQDNCPFFRIASTVAQMQQPFDRKTIRTAVKRLNIQGTNQSMPSTALHASPYSSSSSSPSSSSWTSSFSLGNSDGQRKGYHPLVLQLTSNTPFMGDVDAATRIICRVGALDMRELEHIVRTIEWR